MSEHNLLFDCLKVESNTQGYHKYLGVTGHLMTKTRYNNEEYHVYSSHVSTSMVKTKIQAALLNISSIRCIQVSFSKAFERFIKVTRHPKMMKYFQVFILSKVFGR